MKKIYLTLLTLFISIPAFCQYTFQTGYGDTTADVGRVVIQISGNRYCMVGSTGADYTDSAQIAIYFIEESGNLISTTKFGLTGDEYPTDVAQTNDGFLIITGYTYASPLDTANADLFVIKADNQTGNLVWAKTFGGTGNDKAYSVVITPENRYLILGSTESFGGATTSAFAMKIDQNGDQLWCNVNSVTASHEFFAGSLTMEDQYLAAGYSFDGTDTNNYAVKFDTAGTIIWKSIIGGTGDESSTCIISSSDNHYYLSGNTTSNSAGDIDQEVIKLDTSGNVIWSYNYGNILFDAAMSITEASGGGVIICGTTNVDSTGGIINQMILEKIDTAGTLQWSNFFGSGFETSEGISVIPGFGDGYAASGISMSFGDPNGETYLVKMTDNGFTGCSEFPIVYTRTANVQTISAGNLNQLFVIMPDSNISLINSDFIDQYSLACVNDGIKKTELLHSVKLYPNPSDTNIHLEMQTSGNTIVIYDSFGKPVLKKENTCVNPIIDISELSSGVYFLEVLNDGTYVKNKFIKY